METKTKLYAKRAGNHVHVDFFSGPMGGTRGKNGHLAFRVDEWDTFAEALSRGIDSGNIEIEFAKPEET